VGVLALAVSRRAQIEATGAIEQSDLHCERLVVQDVNQPRCTELDVGPNTTLL